MKFNFLQAVIVAIIKKYKLIRASLALSNFFRLINLHYLHQISYNLLLFYIVF